MLLVHRQGFEFVEDKPVGGHSIRAATELVQQPVSAGARGRTESTRAVVNTPELASS